MHSLQALQRIQQSKINRNSGALKMDKIYFDFTLDNIISVEASKDTDPDTLHERVKTKLRQLMDDGDVYFIFHGKYEND